MRSVLALSLSLAVSASLALAAPAAADFRVNRSMAGVKLGMSKKEVRDRLGAPVKKTLGPNFVNWRYERPRITVTFKPRAVTLFTRSRGQRGPRGIGVGTREQRLRSVLKRLRCRNFEGNRLCMVGSFKTGRRSTVFEMRRGKVRSITISVSTP
jgi:hypothetical protein